MPEGNRRINVQLIVVIGLTLMVAIIVGTPRLIDWIISEADRSFYENQQTGTSIESGTSIPPWGVPRDDWPDELVESSARARAFAQATLDQVAAGLPEASTVVPDPEWGTQCGGVSDGGTVLLGQMGPHNPATGAIPPLIQAAIDHWDDSGVTVEITPSRWQIIHTYLDDGTRLWVNIQAESPDSATTFAFLSWRTECTPNGRN